MGLLVLNPGKFQDVLVSLITLLPSFWTKHPNGKRVGQKCFQEGGSLQFMPNQCLGSSPIALMDSISGILRRQISRVQGHSMGGSMKRDRDKTRLLQEECVQTEVGSKERSLKFIQQRGLRLLWGALTGMEIGRADWRVLLYGISELEAITSQARGAESAVVGPVSTRGPHQ